MTKHQAEKLEKRAPISVHKAINWVVSLILIVFAIWSIMLNADGRSLFKQTTQMVTEIDKKLEDAKKDISTVKDACLKTTVVVPVAPTDNPQNTQ